MTIHPVPVKNLVDPKKGQFQSHETEEALNSESSASLMGLENLTVRREFRRLVVVIPDQVTDQVQFSRAVRNLALPGQKTVLLLMLVNEPDVELAGQRQLATLSSLVNDARIKVKTSIIWDKSWEKFLQEMVVDGDLIVCPAETIVRKGFEASKKLSEILSRSLRTPVTILNGFFPASNKTSQFTWKKLPFWVMVIAIFAVFFEFQAVSDLVNKGWPGQVLIIILVLIEFGFIYIWASIAG